MKDLKPTQNFLALCMKAFPNAFTRTSRGWLEGIYIDKDGRHQILDHEFNLHNTELVKLYEITFNTDNDHNERFNRVLGYIRQVCSKNNIKYCINSKDFMTQMGMPRAVVASNPDNRRNVGIFVKM